MKVTPVAQTQVTEIPDSLRETEFRNRNDWNSLETSDIDLLGETAGRSCYKSWALPNPSTATNDGYLSNIISHQHFSVLEHGSVTFYVEHVSRALLLELERHRHISFSVESQRYVDTPKAHPQVVVPPALRSFPEQADLLQDHYYRSRELYANCYHTLRDDGHSVKKAREASRAFLLESTPVDFFVTGNLRAWRDVLSKRHSEDADEEIQEFAAEVLRHLKNIAPNSVQDIF